MVAVCYTYIPASRGLSSGTFLLFKKSLGLEVGGGEAKEYELGCNRVWNGLHESE